MKWPPRILWFVALYWSSATAFAVLVLLTRMLLRAIG
jgi:hypothetical protein